jgi:hypothetical protein
MAQQIVASNQLERPPARPSAATSVSASVRSSTRLKYAPEASPPGFQYTAEASSATATKAAMPCARAPTASKGCASAATGASTKATNKAERTAFGMTGQLTVRRAPTRHPGPPLNCSVSRDFRAVNDETSGPPGSYY